MKIRVIVTNSENTKFLNSSMYNFLIQCIEKQKGLTLTKHAPDIIHIFGTWSLWTAQTLSKINRYKIPCVYTSLDGIKSHIPYRHNTLNLLNNRKRILQKATIVHASGPLERKIINKFCPDNKIKIVPNPIITNIINPIDMMSDMIDLYKYAIEIHDNTIRNEITNKVNNITDINSSIGYLCNQILYIKYLNQRGCVPQLLLDKLSKELSERQYDEEIMSKAIDKLNMRHFTSSLLTVLQIKSTLTEGYMPINATNDNLAKNIIENIVST